MTEFLALFPSFGFFIALVLLEQTIRSIIWTTLSLQITMSGLVDAPRNCGGTVAGGDSSVLRLGRSAEIEFNDGDDSSILSISVALSACLQEQRPSSSACLHPWRMCGGVACGALHSLQWALIWIFQHRLVRVERCLKCSAG